MHAPDEDGSCDTADQCELLLKGVLDNPDRRWVGQQQSVLAYASGTRLHVYFALRTKLSCEELGLALDELQAAAKLLSADVVGVSSDQVTRVLDLTAEIQDALQDQHSRRCR